MNPATPVSAASASPPVPEDPGHTPDAAKRANILAEILGTEHTFLADMLALQELYVIPGAQRAIWTPAEGRVLFGNVDAVVQAARDAATLLAAACAPQQVGARSHPWVGEAFLQLVRSLFLLSVYWHTSTN